MIRIINLNDKKKSCSWAGVWTHITSFSKSIEIRPKDYDHYTIQGLGTKGGKIPNVFMPKFIRIATVVHVNT